MPKTTKKKPISKAAAAALKAMQNMVIATADLDVHIDQIRRLVGPASKADTGSIVTAGRWTSGPYVQVNISSGGFGSFWPEWAYAIGGGHLQ